MNFREPKLMKACRELECTALLPGCEHYGCVGAHSNQLRHGKGMSIKAHDCFIAAMCARCHHEIDFGVTMNREQKIECWEAAHRQTVLELWRRELIGVL